MPADIPPAFDDEDEAEHRSLAKRLVPVLVVCLVLAAGAGGVAHVLGGKSEPVKPPMLVQTVHLVPLPPPPPPPPPPKQEPKHLDEMKKDDLLPVNPNPTPAKSPNPAPPGPPLGAALGTGGADGYGVGGGGDGGGGPGGKGYGPFVKAVVEKVQAALSRDEVTGSSGYHIVLTLWRDENGRLQRCQLAKSTGNPEIDDRICRVTMAIPDLPQNPADQIGKPLSFGLDSKSISN